MRKIAIQTIPCVVVGLVFGVLSMGWAWLPYHPLLVGLVMALVFRGIIQLRSLNAKKFRKDIEYGSARWGTVRDIKLYVDPKPENNIILTNTESLTMNSRPRPIKYARNKNIMVIGGSGSGKTQFFIKPSLMQCQSKDYPVSFVVTDPKGQLISETGKLLQRNGYRIRVLNTIDFKSSMRYNPFHYIRSEKDILKFVTALIANTQSEGNSNQDPFWLAAEKLLMQALIGFIWYEAPPEEQNMTSLVDMINMMEVRESDESFKNGVDLTFEALEERDPNHFAVRQYKKFKLSAGKTAKSILISCGARLAPFDIDAVRDLMEDDELELDTIGDRKTALFIIVSDTDDSFNFIPAIMYSQLFNLLCDKADNEYGGRLPIHVRFLLDEFAQFKIPKFAALCSVLRSREISVCPVLQTQSQLKSQYKDDMDTIIGNMDSVLFLGGREKTTLEEVSKLLGRESIDIYNTSRTRGMQESYGQNYQKLGRELMTLDELAVMDGSECILQIRGVRPFKSKKYDLTKHPNYRYLSDNDRRNKFDVKKHLSTSLKLKGSDVYEVVEIDFATV